jgi:hypothetical protein
MSHGVAKQQTAPAEFTVRHVAPVGGLLPRYKGVCVPGYPRRAFSDRREIISPNM